MTLSQAFIHRTGADEATANAELEFAGLDPLLIWDANDQTLKCAFYGPLLKYLSRDNVGVKQVSEGGYSITYDKEEKAKYIKELAIESGCPELIDLYSTNKVKNKSCLW